ncbi:hypothetical protein G3T14_10725 [Methylobacterium sp. BTF04]|uniref:hypothetical protein n=1 Tax=Methylobacterium sp. BTF04 TaxID=2708300 RepID=UPI0013D564FF|nr:hypothetical protein [Methylobacterium sp. BTF04]NEU12611.1 hypothetical protein [Methylobacterium sp. BTF04]
MQIPTPTPESKPTRRCTGAARISRRRRLGADRQRELRERRRAAGTPEPEALDRAIVDAMRVFLLRHDDSLLRPIDPMSILVLATQFLQAKARRSAAPDGAIPYDGTAVSEAMRLRLLVPPATERGKASHRDAAGV